MKIEIFGKDYNVSDSLKAITEKKCEEVRQAGPLFRRR